MKIKSISPQDNIFLQSIGTIAKPPERFYYIGALPESRGKTAAIVGSRKPTAYGREVTYDLAYALAKRGVTIVSGLALGVDAIAHRAALDAGGTTIAVLAGGLDSIYPAVNRSLAIEILQKGGALLSEAEPGTPTQQFRLLARNRLVSGLSDTLIVTEAARRSGTFSTVTHALEQGVDIAVVPGNITSPLSTGTNSLITQGAQPIVSIDEFVREYCGANPEEQTFLPLGATDAEVAIIKLLTAGVRSGEELLSQSELDAETFSQTLTMLEIQGIVRALGGNQWTLS